jgi:hypothetical protein
MALDFRIDGVAYIIGVGRYQGAAELFCTHTERGIGSKPSCMHWLLKTMPFRYRVQ